MRVNPHGITGQLEHIASKVFFLFWRVYLPLSMMEQSNGHLTLSSFALLFLAAELTTGYWLAFNFQVSHVSDVADWPLGENRSDSNGNKVMGLEWAKAQTIASVDYSHNNWWTTFCCGALNYQIEHHLFPTVSQYYYPAIAPIVMEVCLKHNVRYNYLKDFPTAFAHHIAHLKKMGQRGEAVELEMSLQ